MEYVTNYTQMYFFHAIYREFFCNDSFEVLVSNQWK
jgi:hypothetical protein